MSHGHQNSSTMHCMSAACLVLMVDGEPATFEALAMQLLHEVNSMAAITVNCGVQPTKYKPYLSNILKVSQWTCPPWAHRGVQPVRCI